MQTIHNDFNDKDDDCNCLPEESRIKKIIRPGTLVLTLLFFLTITTLDGNLGHFTIREAYLPILETVLTTMVIAYFTSRGVEKTIKDVYRKDDFKNPYKYKNLKKDPNFPEYEE